MLASFSTHCNPSNQGRSMKNLLLLPVLAGALLFCDTTSSGNNNSTTSTESLGEEFELKFGNAARIDSAGFTITFSDVPEESRCPVGAECVTIGNAQILLSISDNSVRLNTHNPPRQNTVGNFTIQLLQLTPYPELDNPIEKEDYRATLIVTKNGTFGN